VVNAAPHESDDAATVGDGEPGTEEQLAKDVTSADISPPARSETVAVDGVRAARDPDKPARPKLRSGAPVALDEPAGFGQDAADGWALPHRHAAVPGSLRRRRLIAEGSTQVRRNTRGLTLALMVFAVLLAASAIAGRYLVPPESAANSAPRIGVPAPTGTGTGDPVGPTLPTSLPTTAGRPADALAPWATKIATSLRIPEIAVQAYGYAQLVLAQQQPGCHLSWTTLAGIGKIESQHGQATGTTLLATGRSDPPVNGPVLDGQSGRRLVKDTDAGAYDGNPEFDRAMGPLQLLPTAWRANAIDADNDTIQDPYDIDDASLALGKLLCARGDLRRIADWRAAVARYRPGTSFADSIFLAANDYGRRSATIR
jgi:hypothetical protein